MADTPAATGPITHAGSGGAKPKMKTSTLLIIAGAVAIGGFLLFRMFKGGTAGGGGTGGGGGGSGEGSGQRHLDLTIRDWQGHQRRRPSAANQGAGLP